MRIQTCILFALLAFFTSSLSAATLVDSMISPGGTNNVQTIWNATPGKTYTVQTTTNLSAPWRDALPAPGTLVAVTNWLSQAFTVDATNRFFRVMAVDKEGPEIYRTEPASGGIAVSRTATLRAWLRDETGIATNSLTLTLSNPAATNAPVTLADTRLRFDGTNLTYTPGTNEFLGAAGDLVTAKLSVADTLGNQTTNFTWSFQLELAPVASSNIVFIGGGSQSAAKSPRVTAAASTLTLVSSNGNTFVFSYTGGSSGVTNGMILVNSSLQSGYTVVVTNFTNYSASNTVVVIARPAKLAELLQNGSLVSQTFTEITPTSGAALAAVLSAGLPLNYHHDLAQIVYQDANLTVELLPGSAFDWNGKLDLGVNIRDFRLREFETTLSGTVTANLQARVSISGTVSSGGSVPLITPITKRYGTFVGAVPVWIDVVFEVNAGYTASATATDSLTTGINGTKDILVSRRWSDTEGWSAPFESPAASFSYTLPVFQAEVTANARVYLQPKVTVYAYSVAGVSGDLQPYLELAGSAQASPPSFDLGLYAGLTSTLGLDLSFWDDAWGQLPSVTFNLIPRTQLWHLHNGSSSPPQITVQPQSQAVVAGGAASFSVQAGGSAPLSYRWSKNGLYLTDDSRISGSQSSALRIVNVQTSDVGSYGVTVSNPKGAATSQSVTLSIYPPPSLTLIPASSFTMGDSLGDGDSNELALHSVYVNAFYMDRYPVTKALWDDVYNWAITHGYSFNYGALGKAASHPAQNMTWYDAVKWCNARSEKEGRTPAYYTSSVQTTVYRSSQVDVNNSSVKWNTGYRLPTEAEWEKAARGGLVGQRFPWGSTISPSQAQYYGFPASSGGQSYDLTPLGYHPAYNDGVPPYTSPVGSFAANGYGLYDMAGNVFELCWDWYGLYSSGSESDPVGPASGLHRVLRGGSWINGAYWARCSYRTGFYPDQRYNDIGFRCVLMGASP